MVILRDSPVSAEGAESDIFGVDGIPKIQHVDQRDCIVVKSCANTGNVR